MLTHNYLSFLVNFIEDYKFTVLQLLSLTKWFFIKISIIHDKISSQFAVDYELCIQHITDVADKILVQWSKSRFSRLVNFLENLADNASQGILPT